MLRINNTLWNVSNHTDDDDLSQSQGTVYELLGFGCSLAMITFSVIGAIGNGYAVWHFGRPSSRSSVNVLLTALSGFDFILLITGAPIYSLLGIYSYDRNGETLLALAYSMTVLYPFSMMAQMGSVWVMMLISFERWLGVCHPFVARRELTVHRARISVILVTIMVIAYNLSRFWEYEINSDGVPQPLLRVDSAYLSIYVHWMYLAFVFSIPFLVILVFNILVMAGVRQASVNRPRCQLSAQQRGERKTTLMLLVVVAVFFGCNSLALLLNGYEVLGYKADAPAFEFVSDLNNLLVLAHPAFNIVVYFRFSSKFRNEFLYIVCRYASPSLVSSMSTQTINGYSPGTRRSAQYCVIDAAVVRLNGTNQSIKRARRQSTLANQQRETCMSSSATVTTVAASPSEQTENSIAPNSTKDSLIDNRKLLLKALGFAETPLDGSEYPGTAV